MPHLGNCWVWTKTKNPSGYGIMSAAQIKPRIPVAVHRISWMIHYGKFPHDEWVLHKCDNRACVRPDHLFLGDRITNIKDAVSKGRNRTHPFSSGEDHPLSKLTWDKVREIRRLSSEGASSRQLAVQFCVTKENICMVVKNKTWKESLHPDTESL
jgi:hypothetical protein